MRLMKMCSLMSDQIVCPTSYPHVSRNCLYQDTGIMLVPAEKYNLFIFNREGQPIITKSKVSLLYFDPEQIILCTFV